MNDPTPARYADDAAEAIRALNHATLRPGTGLDWEYPGDAYDVVGHLVAMAERLPQALGQISALVECLATTGHIRSDKGGDGAAEVAAVLAGLHSAGSYAEVLGNDLNDVHSALSPLAYKD